MVLEEVQALAKALYALEWDADLYATPRGPTTDLYEARATRLMRSAYWKDLMEYQWDSGYAKAMAIYDKAER